MGHRQWITCSSRDGHRTLTYVDPIYNEPSCFAAACHVHPREQVVLGVLESDFSLAALDEQIRGQTIDMTAYSISLMIVSSLLEGCEISLRQAALRGDRSRCCQGL
jgi:hypothetical protein